MSHNLQKNAGKARLNHCCLGNPEPDNLDVADEMASWQFRPEVTDNAAKRSTLHFIFGLKDRLCGVLHTSSIAFSVCSQDDIGRRIGRAIITRMNKLVQE